MYINQSNVKLMTFCKPYRNMFVVYKITNNKNDIYIGVTRSLYKRMFQHSNCHKYGPKHSAGLLKDSIIENGWGSHLVEIIWSSSTATEKEAFEIEMQFIRQYNSYFRDNKNGLNKRRGHHDNSHLKINKNCVPVYQYDMETGAFIAGYQSSNEAVRALGKPKYCVTLISEARMGKVSYSCGYFWSPQKMDYFMPIKMSKSFNRGLIIKMDNYGTTINDIYASIKDAAKKNKIPVSEVIKSIEEKIVVEGGLFIKSS